jgi:hypothetical protein
MCASLKPWKVGFIFGYYKKEEQKKSQLKFVVTDRGLHVLVTLEPLQL